MTKLDRHLTKICNCISWITVRLLVVLFIIEALEQVMMRFKLNQMFVMFLVVSAVGTVIIEATVRKQIEKKEGNK